MGKCAICGKETGTVGVYSFVQRYDPESGITLHIRLSREGAVTLCQECIEETFLKSYKAIRYSDLLFYIEKDGARQILKNRGSGSSRKDVQVYWENFEFQDPEEAWATIRQELSWMDEEMEAKLEAAVEEAVEMEDEKCQPVNSAESL